MPSLPSFYRPAASPQLVLLLSRPRSLFTVLLSVVVMTVGLAAALSAGPDRKAAPQKPAAFAVAADPIVSTLIPTTAPTAQRDDPALREVLLRTGARETFLQAELAGGLNNQRICLINALTIARLCNMTLLVPAGLSPFSSVKGTVQLEQKGVGLEEFFDISGTRKLLRMVEGFPRHLKKVKATVKKGTSRQTPGETFAKISEQLRADTNYVKMRCQFAVDWRGFASSLGPQDFLAAVRPSKRAAVAAAQIQAVLGREYNVLHVRAEADWAVLRAAGLKKALESVGASFDPAKVPAQEVEAAFEAAGNFGMFSDGRVPLYIAGGVACTDTLLQAAAARAGWKDKCFCGTIDGRVRKLSDYKAASTTSLAFPPGSMSYLKAAADQEVASGARLFVGRKESSFAAFVAFARRAATPHHLLALPSSLYLPQYETRIKRPVDNSDADVSCFGYPCVLQGGEKKERRDVSRFEPVLLEAASGGGEGGDECLRAAFAASRPGIVGSAGRWPCGVRPAFSWFDPRLLSPRTAALLVSESFASRLSVPFAVWFSSWAPPYLLPLVSFSPTPDTAFTVTFLCTGDPVPHPPPDEAFFCKDVSTERLEELRKEGVFAHRLSWI